MRQKVAIAPSVSALLNKQIQIEAQSSASYLAMAAWCDANGFDQSAAFFYQQSDEERIHMLKLFKYMSDMGASPTSPEVASPNHDYASLLDVFETALDMEIGVTEAIHDIIAGCRKENDFSTESFMQWFVTEQREEEFVARRAVELLSMLSQNENGWLLFEERVGNIAYEE